MTRCFLQPSNSECTGTCMKTSCTRWLNPAFMIPGPPERLSVTITTWRQVTAGGKALHFMAEKDDCFSFRCQWNVRLQMRTPCPRPAQRPSVPAELHRLNKLSCWQLFVKYSEGSLSEYFCLPETFGFRVQSDDRCVFHTWGGEVHGCSYCPEKWLRRWKYSEAGSSKPNGGSRNVHPGCESKKLTCCSSKCFKLLTTWSLLNQTAGFSFRSLNLKS